MGVGSKDGSRETTVGDYRHPGGRWQRLDTGFRERWSGETTGLTDELDVGEKEKGDQGPQFSDLTNCGNTVHRDGEREKREHRQVGLKIKNAALGLPSWLSG